MPALSPSLPSSAVRTSDEPAADATAERREARRAALVGNFVDQFDIFLPVVALGGVLPTHSSIPDGLVFAATLLGRPIGALVLGTIADRHGRALVSRATLLGVSLCTAVMAMLPLHTPGFAVAALLVLRFAAGFFLGGQYSAAIPRALEFTTPSRRGHLSGAIMAMSPLANATIAAVTMVATEALGGAYLSWGWRLLFVAGAVMPLALVVSLRGHGDRGPTAPGSPSTHDAAATAPAAPASTPTDDPDPNTRRTFAALFVLMTGLWLFTMMGVSVLTSMLRTHFDAHDVGLIMLVATAASAATMAAAGALSTRIGRTTFFIGFGFASAVVAPAAYALASGAATNRGILATTLAAAAVQVGTVTAYGPVGALLTEHFPASRRSRGYGTAYSASIVLPGLYPFWLPPLTRWIGGQVTVPFVLGCAGLLIGAAAVVMRFSASHSTCGAPVSMEESHQKG